MNRSRNSGRPPGGPERLEAPRRGDCYWANLDPTPGSEQAGRRPVLVLSVNRYNDRRRMIVGVPLTTKDKLEPPLCIDLGTVSGKRAFALTSQIRGMAQSRLGRRIERGREADVERCLDAFLEICGRRPPRSSPANEGGTP